jgi:hypothetical protein
VCQKYDADVISLEREVKTYLNVNLAEIKK